MTYEPKHVIRWTHPPHYIGETWPDYYSAGVGRHRDSDTLSRSNFECMLSALGGESETVIVVREGHFLVGWIEWIAIHYTDERALKVADDLEKLQDYPIIDEDHWSELEEEEMVDTWQLLPMSVRIEFCARVGLSIFAARHDYPPADDQGMMRDLLLS